MYWAVWLLSRGVVKRTSFKGNIQFFCTQGRSIINNALAAKKWGKIDTLWRNFKELFLSHFRRYWASFSIQNIPLFMAFKVLRFILVGAQSFRRGNAPEDDLSNFS